VNWTEKRTFELSTLCFTFVVVVKFICEEMRMIEDLRETREEKKMKNF
jgi:hypothetical protein